MRPRPHLRLKSKLPPKPLRPRKDKPKYTPEELAELSGRPPRRRYLLVAGSQVYPDIVEHRLGKVRWVKEIGVTARGKGDSRRVVAFVVLEPGRLLRDIEGDLANMANSKLPAYARPQAYAHVESLPRDILGHLNRNALNGGSFDGRIFQRRGGQYRGQGGNGVTITLRNPINEIRFEGVVAFPVMDRRLGDPMGKVRPNEARVVVSHRTNRNSKRGMRVTFLFKGELSAEAKKLQPGDRISVVGKITTEASGRQFVGISFVRVEKDVQRVDPLSTDRVIESLL